MAIGETVITIVGNLTADPELRTTGQGAQVARISRQGGPVYGNPASPQPTVNTGVGGWSQRPQQSAQTQQPAAPPADDPWGAPAADQSSFGDFGKPDPEPEF